jgi:hypothetical protein
MDVVHLTATCLIATAAAAAQIPSIAEINFYGFRHVSPARVIEILKLAPGDRLPASKAYMEDAISDIPGVVLARVEGVCCEGSRAILFIGIEERGGSHPSYRSAPEGSAVLPDNILELYGRLPGSLSELKEYTAGNPNDVRAVLRSGSGADQRAVAAALMAYAPDPAAVLEDLQYALQDNDESVRANAARSLGSLVEAQPSLGAKVSPTWLVQMLNSVALSDRLEAAKALVTLTDRPNPSAMTQLRERALDALAEMARWKTPRYALAPYLLLARLASVSEEEALQRWQKGDQESVIQKAVGATAGRKPRGLQ